MQPTTTRILIAASVLLSVSLSGCVLLNPTDPFAGETRDAQCRPEPSDANPAERVQSIQVAEEESLTLDRAVETALANNPDLSAGRHDVEAAEAGSDIAFGEILPKVDAVGSFSYFRDDRLITPRRPGDSTVLQFADELLTGEIVLRMPLFAGGRFINEIRAARLLEAAAGQRLARTREELIFNVSSVFYSILAQSHVIESLEFSKRALEEHRKRVTELIQVLKAAEVDRLRTEVRIADLEQRLARERNVMAIQRRVLTNLMGLPEDCATCVPVSGNLEIGGAGVPDVAESLGRAMGIRSDYLAARSALEAQARKVDAARAKRYPAVDLEASIGDRLNASDTRVDNEVGSIAVGARLPLFAGGQISAGIRRERARLDAARERLRKLELQVRLDVETAILNMGSSLERVRATEKSIEQAEESLRIEQEKYNYAKGSITDVLDAQSALLASQTNYYRALADYNTAMAEYHLAVGEDQ